MPPVLQMLQRMFVALMVGLLIGLERERAQSRRQQKSFAGVRTFPLIALLGAGMAELDPETGAAGIIAGFLAVAALCLLNYRHGQQEGHTGATTEMAALGTYVLGAFAGFGELVVAGAIGVAVAVLLAAKPHLESFSRALTEQELVAVLQLAVISAIVLPILPDKGYPPYEALNPFKIWLVVVLISAISFGGFFAIRLFGDRFGVLLAALVGAVASSTAVTMAMAERSRQAEAEGAGRQAAAGAVLASIVMCARIAVLVAVTGPRVLPPLAPTLLAMAATGGLAVLWLGRRARHEPAEGTAQAVTNPFRLRSALLFGAIYAVILVLVRAAHDFFGSAGLFVAAAMSGLADVDPITLALAREVNGGGAPSQLAAGIALAAVANMIVKLGIAVSAGQGAFRRDVALALGAMGAAGLAAAAAVYVGGGGG
jgi:uncharacterized membrane protein (DUF4010 family)